MTNDPGDGPWRPAIHAKLAGIAETMPQPPSWYEQWLRLGPKSSDEGCLRVYQAIRDAGDLPAEAGFHLVSWHIDAMSCAAAETELRDLEDQMTEIERAHGLEEYEFWASEEAPAEYEQLRQLYQSKWDAIYVRLLRQYGEAEMADLLEHDAQEFERRGEAGRFYFHGPLPLDDEDELDWLDELAEIVAAQMTADSAMGPLKVQYRHVEGLWEVLIYPAPVELVGGAVDGEVVAPGFSLDLEGLRAAFDEVIAFCWQSLGLPHDEGPQVWLEGIFRGHGVFLRILAYAPEDEPPGMKLNVMRGRSQP